ncbi:MAG: MopE-related protein [Flavobacteriales bacterium]
MRTISTSGILSKLLSRPLILFFLFLVSPRMEAQVFWTETFGTGCNHSNFVTTNGTWVSVNTGTNNSFANRWYMSAAESGNDAGTCGTACTAANDKSMHVSASFSDLGAAYLAGGLACITNKRIESPTINCTGRTNITVSFNYIENGQGTLDNASIVYYNGTAWALLEDLPKTLFGTCAPQGLWTNRQLTLPASANNNALVKIGFLWTNNNDNIGTDPSFAVDDITLSTPVVANSIATGTISGTPLCTCGAVTVPFTSIGTFAVGNNYTAQLSNASGSFAAPTAIGTLASTANSGTISATIPCSAVAGTLYRIRVVSSNPVVTGTDNGVNITINAAVTYYLDADSDGYYANTQQACASPGVGWSTTASTAGDCNDSNAEINPSVEEGCNCIDDNCNGQIDETCDYDVDTYTSCNGDCDNYNAAINPAALEICNNIDDDCDGQIDEGFDADGDGATTCAGDCNDSNPSLNPWTVWYADLDGDGYGSYIFATQCTNPGVAGVVMQGGDCDDYNPLIHAGVVEICANYMDDDCDGFTDEGCSGIPNDHRSDAQWVSNDSYPQCNWITGTCLNADISAEGNAANVLVGAGRDVWYRFVAPGSAVQVRVQPTGFDAVIELQNSTNTELNVENINTFSGLEILNFVGLVVGQTYYVAVRNYNNTAGGGFTICISPIINSYCADGSGTYEMCSNLKAKWTGANSYTYACTPINATPGMPTTGSSSTQIPLSNAALTLRHTGQYDVRVDGNFNLMNGLVAPEIIVVAGVVISQIAIAPHASVEVKSAQRCPATLLKGSVLQGKPFLCGATSYTVEFTKVSDCTGTTDLGLPFEVNTTGSSSSLLLSFSAPQSLSTNSYYKVRFRPNFGYGSGSFGTARFIYIGGSSAPELLIHQEFELAEKNIDSYAMNIFPNPSDGDYLNLNIHNVTNENLQIQLFDVLGRMVYSKAFQTSGALNTVLVFETRLASGIYKLYVLDGGHTSESIVIVE